MEGPPRPHRRLIWKYTAVVVTLVAAAIVSVGLTELYFSYKDSRRALTRVERDKASAAAASIEQQMRDILRQLEAVAQPTVGRGRAGLVERNQDFLRLIDREPLVSRLTYLDARGRERVRTSPFELDRLDSGVDRSRTPAFVRARAAKRFLGPVYFLRGSQPHMTVAVGELGSGGGVVAADIDLSFVREVLDRARIGSVGYAYAVDSRGELVSHPDINLVLRHTSFASLPQVRTALEAPANGTRDAVTTGRNESGTEVLSAYRPIASLGWRVFVEEPSSEALAPLEAAIWRTALLLVAFLLLAGATGVLLARRLVRPIESIQTAAAKIGSGALDQRIEVASHDELGALAEEFNRMAEQLRGSYADLERKVEERTAELATALRELDEKSRQLEAASVHKSAFLASMAAGWEIDAHTLTHPDLTTLSGSALRHEVAGSRAEIRRRFGVTPRFFCYPAGRYDADVLAAVRAAGFEGATTVDPGLAVPTVPFTLARLRVDRGDGSAGLARKLAALGLPTSASRPS